MNDRRAILELQGIPSYGVVAYPEDVDHYVQGDVELIPGLWYYDENYDMYADHKKAIDALVERGNAAMPPRNNSEGRPGRKGNPYRVLVKYKNTLSEPKYFTPMNYPCEISVFFCLLFCSVTLTYRNVQAPSFFFAPAKFSWIIRRVRPP